MDALITLIRIPFGIIGSLVVIVFYFGLFIPETILLLIAFPFAAIFMDRCDLRYSWIGSYPNSMRAMGKSLENIWGWVSNDGACGF